MHATEVKLWGDLCDDLADRFGDKTAFVNTDGVELSFAGFRNRVNKLNNALAAKGLHKGDRVAILSKNCTEYLETYGLAKSGYIVVPLNWRLTAEELLRLLEHCKPRVIIADVQDVATIESIRSRLSDVDLLISIGGAQDNWIGYEDLISNVSDEQPRTEEPLDPGDVVCLMYTSGTTGMPKGVAMNHRGVLGNARVSAGHILHLTPEDRTLAAMPLFHAGGMWYHLHPSYSAGCTSVIMAGFDAPKVLDNISKHAITNVHLVPTMIGALLAAPGIGSAKLETLRLIFYAASSIPLELLKRALATFAGCDFVQSYGSTEAGMITDLTASDHLRAIGGGLERLLSSCGRPVGGSEIRIADDDGVTLPVREIGEILIRGKNMMSHYWKNEEATQKAVVDGWFHSGDLGCQDDEGYIYLVDRKNDMIVTGGENVYPSEVEEVLCSDPVVAMASVFGIPDPVWVERVVAAVVLKRGAQTSEQEIIARARQHLAAYKCPKEIFLHEKLPMNAVGKISKKDLKLAFINK